MKNNNLKWVVIALIIVVSCISIGYAAYSTILNISSVHASKPRENKYAYDSSNENWHGPRTGYQYLPSTSEWNNPGLIIPGTRQIVTETGSTSTSG